MKDGAVVALREGGLLLPQGFDPDWTFEEVAQAEEANENENEGAGGGGGAGAAPGGGPAVPTGLYPDESKLMF